MLTRTMHFPSWIYQSVPLLILMTSTLWPYNSRCLVTADINAELTSTPYSVTLSFEPNPSATNYTASFRVFNSPFLNDIALEPPYNTTKRLNATYYDVSPGLNYTVTLYENQTSKDYSIFSEHISTVPLPPIDVRIQDKGTTYLVIAWENNPNITTYSSHQIYFRQNNETAYQTRYGTAQESYTLQGLYPGFVYDVYVTAIAFDFKDDKESQPSLSLSSPTLPAPPTNVTAEAENTTHITVTWIPQASSFQDSFEVTYLTQGSNTTAVCNDSPCSITPGPPAGQEVDVFVSAVSHGVKSVAQHIKTSTEPDPVSDLKAIEGVRTLDLSWKVPINTAITSYLVWVVNIPDNSTRNSTVLANPGETLVTYPLTALWGGSVYKVYVSAETPYAKGKPRIDVFNTVPEPVTGLEGTPINTTAFQLVWKNPRYTLIDNIIIVVVKPDGNKSEIKEDKDTENKEVVGLIPGETYQVIVYVHTPHTVQVSEARNVSITIKPIKPKLVSSTSGEEDISIVLSRVEDIGAFSSIQASLNSSSMQIANSDGVIMFGGLTPGTKYSLKMVTLSGQEKSEVVPMTLYTKPRPPQNMEVEVVNSTSIRVSWEAPDEGKYDAFVVTVVQLDGGSQQMVKTTPELSVDFNNVMAGTTYNVSVVSVKGDQQSVALQGQNTTAPLGISDIRLSIRGIESVTLTWDPPVGSHLEGYALTFDLTNVTLLELPGSATQYKLDGLEPDTNYTIQIFTFALRPMDGVKLYSPPKRFNFSTYPESVAALQKVDASENSITVNWTDPAVGDFNGYNLGIKEEISGRESRPLFLPRSYTNYTFEKLLPGKVYLVAIRTILRLPSGRQRYGILVRLRAVTKPLPVDSIQVLTLNTTALQVDWSTNDNSSQDKFLISYEAEGMIRTTEMPSSNTSQDYDVTLTQLLSGASYTVQVVVIRSIMTDSEDSLPAIITGYTKPNPVSNLTLVRNEDSMVTVTWSPPVMGGVDLYHIRYRSELRDPSAEFQLSTSTMASKTLVDLFPGEKYEVQVVAVRHDLESDEMKSFVVLKPLAPVSFVQNKDKTMTDSVSIQWSYDTSDYYTSKWVITYTGGSDSWELEELAKLSGAYSRVLPGLTAGQTYTVAIRSEVLNLTSDVRTLMATAKPVINTDIEEVSTTNESVTFAYTVKTTDIFDSFVFSVDPEHTQPVDRLKNESVTMETMTGLKAGTQYMLYAFTKSRSELSSGFISKEFITDPNPVPVQLSPLARQITVQLGAQQGGAAEYVISCMPDCGTETVPAGITNVPFANLKPFSTYFFTVVTKTIRVNDKVKQVEREYEQKTNEAAPSEVQMLTVSENSIHSVTLSWRQPVEINGVLKNFILSYRGRESNYPSAPVHENILTLPPTQLRALLQELKAGYTYTFQIFAKTVADGKSVQVDHTMKTASPTFKSNITPESSRPSKPDAGKAVTQKTISLKFVNPFSTEAGFVRYYSVIVSRDPEADDNSVSLPSWEEAKKDKKILVYEAVTKCEDFFAAGSSCGTAGSGSSSRKRRATANDLTTREFVVGDQTASDCQGQASCNGPLSEGTSYYIKLRGFTQSGQYQDTAYSEKIKTGKKSTSNSGAIGGSIGGLIAVMVGVGVVAFIVVRRRKRCPKKATKHAGPRISWEQSTMNNFSRPVKLAHFPDHVRKMAADSDFKYAEEYEDLKETGRDQPTLASEFPPNRPKNRFTNILPYDHSRVKLLPTDDEEGSDYINANYMPGYNSKREYIATQGPLPATRDDFWRMLWEQCSRNIVMLTRCQEKGREKSDHYWPSDSEPKFYGDLQVVILNETHMPDWTIVEFRVSHGEQSRQVRHFHYRVWPDFGVPKDPASLIRFVRTVREKLIREGGPIVLHCSAGVGRSGTFIVLDHLLQLIREKDEVDIFSIVYKLRKERVLMVQTEQQYKFIHECLLCVLENREHDTTYANLGQINVGFEDDEGINLEGP